MSIVFPINYSVLFIDGSPTDECNNSRGVYCWVNTVNSKKYVGIAAGVYGFRGRLLAEANVSKDSGAKLLQKAIKKYGIENFVVLKLADLTGDDSDTYSDCERAYIKSFQTLTPNGYNITEGGKGTLGFSSPSGRIKRRGKANVNVSVANSKRCELISPSGERHYVVNISAFSRSLGFPSGALYPLARGEATTYKGWRSGTISRSEYANKLSSCAFFVSPEGEVVCVKNIKRFAMAHGLGQGAMNGIWTGRKSYITCKGWRRATQEEIDDFDSEKQRVWEYNKWRS